MYKTFLSREAELLQRNYEVRLLFLHRHLRKELSNQVNKQSNKHLQKSIKNKLDIVESAREATKIQKKPSKNARITLTITFIFAVLSATALFAGAQAVTSVPSEPTAVNVAPSSTLTENITLSVLAAKIQNSSWSGLPVLGIILGLATIAAYVMEKFS